MASPVPLRNDIISGQDFLSLFIEENPTAESSAPSTPSSTLSTRNDLQVRGRSLALITISAPILGDKSETETVFGDIGNDIIPASDDASMESSPLPQSTPLVTRTTTTRPRSLSSSSSSSSNKRVIVRKLVNVHSRSRNTKTVTLQPPSLTTTTASTNKTGQEGNYLDEAADRTPINSHRSEPLFIEEVDAKDLTSSESMNVPRIVKLPPTTTTTVTGSQSSSSSSSSSSTTQLLMVANEGVLRGSTDNEASQRNSPFTLQQNGAAVTMDGNGQVTEDDDDDLVSNASNNDQLMQEQRMSTSRSRTQRKQIDTSSSAVAAESPEPADYQTVVYGSIQQQKPVPKPIRLPVPRSIAYPRREQRISPPSPPLYQAKVYSEPAKVYSEPAKFYSEPAKVYSEPAKVYGQPAKFYSEQAKVYSEPAKNYGVPPTPFPTTTTTTTTTPKVPSSTTQSNRKILFNLDKLPYDLLNAPNRNLELQRPLHEWNPSRQGHMEELFYNSKVAEKPTVVVDEEEGEEEEPQEKGPEVVNNENVQEVEEEDVEGAKSQTKSGDNNKTGYVVEGRTYRKYRVEEKTPDGFIVGEYGVVSHNDGNLRGVRYTADSNINPRLIYDALLKFLSL